MRLEHRQEGPRADRWTALQRVGFRSVLCYLLLYYGDGLLHWLPGMSFVLSWPEKLWHFLMYSLAVAFLHPSRIVDYAQQTGSGDRLIDYVGNAVCLLLTGIVVVLWSSLDRRRDNYEILEGWLRVFARYALALTLISYGMAKVIPMQFPHLNADRLNETYGASSPMGLLWNFMGYSTGYTVFAGLMEVLPGLLLLFRRTALLGALIAFSVLINVVALNLCYDVPVKLFSVNLLLLSGYLLWPYARPLWGLLVEHASVGPFAEAKVPFSSGRAAKLVFLARGIFLALVLLQYGIAEAERYFTFQQGVQPPHSSLTDRGFHWVQEAPFNR